MLEDVSLLTRQTMWLQQDGVPHFGMQVTAYMNQVSRLFDWPRWPLLGQRDHQIFFAFGLLSMGSHEIPGVYHQVKHKG